MTILDDVSSLSMMKMGVTRVDGSIKPFGDLEKLLVQNSDQSCYALIHQHIDNSASLESISIKPRLEQK